MSSIIEMEKLKLSYDLIDISTKQQEILKVMADSLSSLYTITKPYDYRRIFLHPVTEASDKREYNFPCKIYQITVMPVPAAISIYLDWDPEPYELEEGESLNITSSADLMRITNSANPTITEEVRIYIFGRK